jgi:hypothetical protein
MRRKVHGALFASALVSALLLLALLAGGAAGGHGKGKGPTFGSGTHGRIGYHFLVVDQLAGVTAPDRVILQGDGSFNRNRASGGGTFDHFLAGTGPPATLVATGTWKAEDVVSWSPGLSHGIFEGGTLMIHATVKPVGQPAIKNVLVAIYCNLGPAGFSTGHAEGVDVTLPDGTVFTQTSPTTGVTVFSLNKGHKH